VGGQPKTSIVPSIVYDRRKGAPWTRNTNIETKKKKIKLHLRTERPIQEISLKSHPEFLIACKNLKPHFYWAENFFSAQLSYLLNNGDESYRTYLITARLF
jgi:hypothetical protein